MGAPRGNSNAAGSRKSKTVRYQNISTVITSVMQNGRSRVMKPRQALTLTEEDVQETEDAYQNPDKTPFALGLLAAVEEGKNHVDAPAAPPTMKPEALKLLVAEGSLDEIEEKINSCPDHGGIMTFHRVMIDLGDSLNKKRRELVEDMIDTAGSALSAKNKKSRIQYEERLG